LCKWVAGGRETYLCVRDEGGGHKMQAMQQREYKGKDTTICVYELKRLSALTRLVGYYRVESKSTLA